MAEDKNQFTVEGNIVDIVKRKIYKGIIEVKSGKIKSIKNEGDVDKRFGYYLPGLIDAHVHIESSMLVPSEFARLAVVHGTTGTVSDPHEIANVCGLDGVDYMIKNGESVPFHFAFGAPSCVPATPFETAGASLDVKEVKQLLSRKSIKYLSEMMNFPAVLKQYPDVLEKLEAAKQAKKVIDGHAPGLRGDEAKAYANAGILTDHECFTLEEARDKLKAGMKIIIREGSAAKNFEELYPLIDEAPDKVMFCSDDKHPDSLLSGHINEIVKRAIDKGADFFNVIAAATYNPVKHYSLESGLLQEGDSADFIQIDEPESFNVKKTWIKGNLVAENGKSLIEPSEAKIINQFDCEEISPEQLRVFGKTNRINTIQALDGQLITKALKMVPLIEKNHVVSDTENDVLKIIVINRYHKAPVAIGFVNGFGIKSGAIASSVAHDSHNIIACGTSDEAICKVANRIIQDKGGIAAYKPNEMHALQLPVGGLMSVKNAYQVAEAYKKLDTFAKKSLKSKLSAPFMTLSFMALLVIPELKIGDKGLFDVQNFQYQPLFD